MDLDRVRVTKVAFDSLEPEEKAEAKANSLKVKGYLAKSFPAIPETDLAAFAWFLAETIEGLRQLPVSALSKILLDSEAAYALATVDLLGWADE